MKKNGFTLVELLAIIILIAVIAGISVASIMGVNNKTKEKMLQNKLELIEEAAQLYVNKNNKGINTASIMNSPKKYHPGDHKAYPCVSIAAKDLVPEFLDADLKQNCASTNGDAGCIINPADSNSYLDNVDVILYYKNNRIYAKADIDNEIIEKYGRNYSDCYLYGDFNNDGSVNNEDFLNILRCMPTYYDGMPLLDDLRCSFNREDINLDGTVDCYDLCLVNIYVQNVQNLIDYIPTTNVVSSCEGAQGIKNIAGCSKFITTNDSGMK